jgi:TolB-like protein
MKKILLPAFFITLLVQTGYAYKQIEKASGKISEDIIGSSKTWGASVAVMPFQNPDGGVSELGRLISDAVNDNLVKNRKFSVLDRVFISKLLGEIKFNLSGFTDQKTVMQLGKFGGAGFMLVGTIEPYGEKKLIVHARLIQTETSAIAGSAKAEVKFDDDMKKLYRQKASGDPVLAALLPEGQVTEDAVFLNQTGRNGCKWVESRSFAPVTDGTPVARVMAVSLSRQKAVSLVSGSRQPVRIDFQDSAIQNHLESILRLTKSPVIEEERITEESVSDRNYKVVLQTCLKPARENEDKEFKVELLLNQNSFNEGQEARALVVSNRDAWLYIYSADFDGNLSRVFPFSEKVSNKIEAGKPFAFPDEDHRQAGVSLVARLLNGADSSVETLWAVAVKRDAGVLLQQLTTSSGIAGALDAAGDEWAGDIRVYTIHK